MKSRENVTFKLAFAIKIWLTFTHGHLIDQLFINFNGLKMVFQKGQSGNLAGRPPGLKHREFFDEAIKEHKSELMQIAITKAKSGKSPILLKFLLERFVPKIELHPLEYERTLLEIEKLQNEIKLLREAPMLLELIKEDPYIKDRLREKGINFDQLTHIINQPDKEETE